MARFQLALLLSLAVANTLVAEVVPFNSRSAAVGSKKYQKTGMEKRTGEVANYEQDSYYPHTTVAAKLEVDYNGHEDSDDMDAGSSHQYIEYQNYQQENRYAATQAANRPLKTRVRYHEQLDTEDDHTYQSSKNQYATGEKIRNKQRRRKYGPSSHGTKSSASDKHDSYGLSYYCKSIGGKYTEIVALLSFLSLAFIVFYLLYLSRTTTTTTGKEIEGNSGFTKTIQDFAGYVQSNLNSNCGQYRLCEMAKFSQLANFYTFSIGFFSEAWTNGLDDSANCAQIYPNCSLWFLS